MKHAPMSSQGPNVYLANHAGGFEVRHCPDFLELASDIVLAVNSHDALVAALNKAREDINWMLNSRQFLNAHVFDYIDEALDGAERAK